MSKSTVPRGVAPQVSISGQYTQKEYRQHLREESRKSDTSNKRKLPFEFSINDKGASKPQNKGYVCDCGDVIWVSRDCYMVTCTRCNSLKKIDELTKIKESLEVTTQINTGEHKGTTHKPGPFTKEPARDNSKGRWI